MNEFKYKGYEITKGAFIYKWFVWDKDDNYVSMHWSKEDAEDAIDKLVVKVWQENNMKLIIEGWELGTDIMSDGSIQEYAVKDGVRINRNMP